MRGGARRRALALGALVAANLLAGCVGSDEELSTPTDGPAAEPAALNVTVRRHALDETLTGDHWTNGSFPACTGTACQAQVHEVDITGDLPTRAPLRLLVEATFERVSDVYDGLFALQLVTDDATFYRREEINHGTAEQSIHTINATLLVRGGVSRVILERSAIGTAPEVPFTLLVRVVAASEWTPGLVPVAFDVASPQRLLVEVPNATEPFVLALFDPGDVQVLRETGLGSTLEVDIDEGMPSGAYVLVLDATALDVRISATGDAREELRALPLAAFPPPMTHTTTGSQPIEWTVDLPGPVIRIDVGFFSANPSELAVPTWHGTVRIESRAGVVLEAAVDLACPGLCVPPFSIASVGSEFAPVNGVPGTYNFRYTPTEPQLTIVTETILAYDRAA